MAYYKMHGNWSLTIWSGSMWIPSIEDVKYLLENGSLRYLGEYNPILEKK